MSEVQVIKASSTRVNRKNSKVIENTRVAAYCRVSTDSEEQLNSYNSQVEHYRQFVQSNPEWSLVDIYADEAISGTQTDKRMEFQRMINDALDGKIDFIITKSISRFARNTLDTLKYVRLLKEHSIAIFFEKENINTLTMNGEMLLVILSSLAQQESESISANVKMGLKMKMKRGELIGFQGCLGYDYDSVEKTLSVNEEEAEVVKYIFKRYTEGAGCFVIAKELTKLKYKTKKGNTDWHESTVRGIIKNEKYKGDLLLGKTFTVDPISHRRLDNMGEEEKYYISDHHEPIISEEMFSEAQKILNQRSSTKNNKGRLEKYSQKYTFSSMLFCGFCGKALTRRNWHSGTTHEKRVWQCVTATKKGKMNCPDSKGLDESVIEQAFVEAFNMMYHNNKEIVDEFLANVEKTLNSTNTQKELKQIQNEISAIELKLKKLVDMRIDGVIDKGTYEEKYLELSSKMSKLKTDKTETEVTLDEENTLTKRIETFRKLFERNASLVEFDPIVFKSIVEKVIVGDVDENNNKNPYMITFVFKTGLRTNADCSGKKKTIDKKACSHSVHDTRGKYCHGKKNMLKKGYNMRSLLD